MKQDIHPEDHRQVIFEDSSNGARFLIYSTAQSEKTAKWEDGKEYPLVSIEVSSASHPFYTGAGKVVTQKGRVERFRKRQEAAKKG